ncbi:hypothetical protein [Salibacterium aidingense]|uniref:hypothetical protein n=1 Tax=Salibacterium aidingense TaxID=384933 RepID=UPI003BEBB2B9
MAKYEAHPNYTVKYGDEKRKTIDFDPYGKYETSDKTEISVLNGLCPKYVTCVEADKPKSQSKATGKQSKATTEDNAPSSADASDE